MGMIIWNLVARSLEARSWKLEVGYLKLVLMLELVACYSASASAEGSPNIQYLASSFQ